MPGDVKGYLPCFGITDNNIVGVLIKGKLGSTSV